MTSQFRTWLVDRVSEARLSKREGESLADRARRLGVQADVLEEAEVLRQERLLKVGRFSRGQTISNSAYTGYVRQVSLYMPDVVSKPLEALAAMRSLGIQDVARAAVHTLLLGPDNPVWRGKGWLLGGKVHSSRRTDQRKLVLSVGADIALAERAARLGATKTGLIRGLLGDLIEGRLRKLIYVDVASMWNDPKKYWTGELISAGNYEWLRRPP